jgi:outer membrane efflux protein
MSLYKINSLFLKRFVMRLLMCIFLFVVFVFSKEEIKKDKLFNSYLGIDNLYVNQEISNNKNILNKTDINTTIYDFNYKNSFILNNKFINNTKFDKFIDDNKYSSSNKFKSSYSFNELLNYTLINSPTLNLAKQDIMSAINEYDYSKASYYPEIGISANSEYSKRFNDGYSSLYVGKDNLVSNTSYSNSVSFVMNYDLYTFGKDSFKAKAAKENIDASKYKKCMSNYEVSLKLLDNYYEALRYKNQIRYYEILKLIYQKLYTYQKRLSSVGEIDKLALGESAIILADTDYELSSIRLNANNSLNTINQIVGSKIDDISKLEDFNVFNKEFRFIKFEDTFIAKEFDYELKTNEYELKSEQRAYYPTISLYAKYDLYGNDRDDYFDSTKDLKRHGYRVGLSFYLSLFDGGKKKARIKDKEINKEKILLRKEEARLKYEKDIADLELFLSKEDSFNKILKELKEISKNSYNMQEALSKAKESSKIEVLNSYVVLLKKEMSYKEHLLKAGYFINKANIMSGINECKSW